MFDYLFPRRNQESHASIAKKRLLQVIVSEAYNDADHPVDLRLLQRDLLGVLAKYYPDIDLDQVKVGVEREENCSVLELNIMLPDQDSAPSV